MRSLLSPHHPSMLAKGSLPPRGPDDLELVPVDEGPLRRELLRQIGHLELALLEIRARHFPFESLPTGSSRSSGIQPTGELELIRDELIDLQGDLEQRIIARFRDGLG